MPDYTGTLYFEQPKFKVFFACFSVSFDTSSCGNLAEHQKKKKEQIFIDDLVVFLLKFWPNSTSNQSQDHLLAA